MFTIPTYKQIRVILDTDAACEADDPFAIVHALLSPKLIVKGICATHFASENSMERSFEEIKTILADMEIEGYNACGVYADGEGKIYPWLEEGDYIFILDGVPHLAHVTSSGAVAEPWLSGVTANGTDLAYLHDENGQWAYNFRKRTLYILSGSSPADCVTVSGTNTADYVYVVATNDVYFAISNLNLKTTSAAPIALACANATVSFAGTNTLDASGASQYAALQTRTAQSAWTGLVLTNLDEGATLVAKGGSGGAGIGCRSTSSSSYCKVYVYGGNITAEGGLNGSGIGGGSNGSSEVYIYGGRVTAAGGSYAAGIGGGKDGQGRVDIHGGIVDATATAGGGAGIGGGANGDGTVSVIDGAVTACGNGLGAGIGGGSGGKGYVYVRGGTVKPIAGTYAASKSVGNGNTTRGEVLFTGGSIHTTVDSVNPAASNANHVAVWPVTVTGLKAGSEITFDGLPSSYGTNGICADEDGKVRLWLPNGDYAFTATDDDGIARLYVAPVADAPADATYSAMTGFTVNGCDVAYLSGEGWSYSLGAVNGGITLSGLDHYELSGALTNKYLTIGNSCSIVFSNVVFNSFNIDTQHGIVNIAGAYDVDLTIEGENSVKAPSGGYLAGIRVPTGATLTIDGGGSLESTAGPYAAGIGGGRNSGCGAITINGGTVTATGGNRRQLRRRHRRRRSGRGFRRDDHDHRRRRDGDRRKLCGRHRRRSGVGRRFREDHRRVGDRHVRKRWWRVHRRGEERHIRRRRHLRRHGRRKHR